MSKHVFYASQFANPQELQVAIDHFVASGGESYDVIYEFYPSSLADQIMTFLFRLSLAIVAGHFIHKYW